MLPVTFVNYFQFNKINCFYMNNSSLYKKYVEDIAYH